MRWQAGDSGEVSGIPFRVVAGGKTCVPCKRKGEQCSHDLRLEWMTSSGWRSVGMDVGLMLADFLCCNEEVLYPQEIPGLKGGNKYLHALRHAWTNGGGWRDTLRNLEVEKRMKNETLF